MPFLPLLLSLAMHASRPATSIVHTIQRANVPLSKKEPVSGGLTRENAPFSIGGVVFDTAVWCRTLQDHTRTAVFDMGKSFASFVFAIGTKDDYSGMDSCRYAIALDGITVLSGEVSHGQRPLRKVIDVRGKRSLRIELQSSVALGEPTLSYNYIPPTDGNAGGNGDPAPRFAASAGEAIIEDGTVKLRWDKSPGATAYGVLVVLDNPSGGSSRERMWSYTTGRLPEQNILVKELPKGSFLWYVVPLSEGKSLSRPMPMGDFKI